MIETPIEHVLSAGWPASIDLGPGLTSTTPGCDRLRALAAHTDLALLLIPTEFGGLGGSLADAAAAQRALGRKDPSAAVAMNMHTLSIGLMVEYWDAKRDVSWMMLEGIAGSRSLVASAFAEPGGGPNFLVSRTTATQTADGGFLLNGTKFPCSLCHVAELLCVTARAHATGDTIMAICPTRSPGVEISGVWDSIGMADSDSGRVDLHDVHVDRRLVFFRLPENETDRLTISGFVWFSVLMTATYHGVLSRLLQLAADATEARPTAATDRPGPRQTRLGDGVAALTVLGQSCINLARVWPAGNLSDSQGLALALALRSAASDVRDEVARVATELLGGRSYTAGDEASSLLIDSAAIHHHPPGLLFASQAVGALALGRTPLLDVPG